MKKRPFYLLTLLAFICIDIALTVNNGNIVHSRSTGAPASKTNSPGDGGVCTDCHTGNSLLSESNLITSTIPSEGYTPGSTYTITASISKTGIDRFGFQISPQNVSGTLLGTLTSTSSETQLVGSGKYITHTSSGITATSNAKSWSFSWIAPVAGTGSVTFYGAFNATNNSGTNAGDQIYVSTYTVSENITVGLNEEKKVSVLQIFPNPIIENFSILNNLTTESIELISIDGKVIQEFVPNKTNSYSIAESVENGMYLMKIKSKNKTCVERIIIAK